MKTNLNCFCLIFIFAFATNISFAQKKDKKEKPSSGYDFQGPFCNGLAKVKKNNKWGFIDTKGAVIVVPKYTQVENFNDGLARVRMGSSGGKVGGWGLVDTNGVEIVKPMFEWIYDFVDGKARVKSEGVEGWIDRKGNMVGKKE